MNIGIKIFTLLLLIFGGQLSAANISNTHITLLMVDKNHTNKVFIRTSISHPIENPACHTSEWDFVMPYKDDFDKAMFSMLLTAFSAQKLVTLYGNGVCELRSDIETLRRIEMK